MVPGGCGKSGAADKGNTDDCGVGSVPRSATADARAGLGRPV